MSDFKGSLPPSRSTARLAFAILPHSWGKGCGANTCLPCPGRAPSLLSDSTEPLHFPFRSVKGELQGPGAACQFRGQAACGVTSFPTAGLLHLQAPNLRFPCLVSALCSAPPSLPTPLPCLAFLSDLLKGPVLAKSLKPQPQGPKRGLIESFGNDSQNKACLSDLETTQWGV